VSQQDPTLVHAIVSAFADVFVQPDARPDSDFFDLGGDSLAAAMLMLALERVGVQLPVAALLEAPTPAGLAKLVASGAAGTVLPLVTLKPGDAAAPVFLLPGAGGSVLEMVPFARRVETRRALLGLQSLDTCGLRLPVTSIEALAAVYLPLVRRAQPHGPYTLAGYSMGGVAALELAQRLQASGETVARVIMIDTLTPLAHFPPMLKLRFWGRRLAFHARRARALDKTAAGPYLLARIGGLARDFGLEATVSRKRADERRTAEARAFVAYRPRRYDGSIGFIQAEIAQDGTGFYPDLLWRRRSREFRLLRVAGDHFSMLSGSAEALARAFAALLP
jgi:acetoacetyl-CoA synthetase